MSRQNPVGKKRKKGRGREEAKRTDRKHPPERDVTFFFAQRKRPTDHPKANKRISNVFKLFENFIQVDIPAPGNLIDVEIIQRISLVTKKMKMENKRIEVFLRMNSVVMSK